MSTFAVIDVGCLECRIESTVLGHYATRAEATTAARAAEPAMHESDHAVTIFELPAPAPGAALEQAADDATNRAINRAMREAGCTCPPLPSPVMLRGCPVHGA